MSATGTTVTLYSQDSTPNFKTAFAPLPETVGGGETFTPSQSAALIQVNFRLARTSDVAGSAVCMIFHAGGGLPGEVVGFGLPIATSDPRSLADVPVINTAPEGGTVPFIFSNPPTVQAGHAYIAVISAAFSGTTLYQLGSNTNPDPLNNAAVLVDTTLWTALAGIDYNMIVIGFIATGTVILNVLTLFSDGSAAVPVKATLSNPTLGVNQTKTSVFGPFGNVLPFTIPAGTGYIVTLDYTDCAGDSQTIASTPFDIFSNTTISNPLLRKPSPALTADIDLVKWKARPDFHHFSLSKDGPIDTIFALLANKGTETECVVAEFVFTLPNGSQMILFGITQFVSSENLVTDYAKLTPGQELEVALAFAPTMLGRYTVDVSALWDVALPIPRLVTTTKTISFDVVP